MIRQADLPFVIAVQSGNQFNKVDFPDPFEPRTPIFGPVEKSQMFLRLVLEGGNVLKPLPLQR